MLGFGFSDKPWPHKYNIKEQAEILKSLVGKLNISTFHVLAHDYGVSVAQELLAQQQYGENGLTIQSIVFLNGGVFPSQHRPLITQTVLANPTVGPILAQFIPYSLFAKGIQRVFGEKIPATEEFLTDAYLLNTHKYGLVVSSGVLSYMQDRRDNEERWVGALKWAHSEKESTKVNLPLYIINGPADPVSGKHLYDYYMSNIPNAKGYLLNEGVGHFPLLQDVEGTTKAFLNFHFLLK